MSICDDAPTTRRAEDTRHALVLGVCMAPRIRLAKSCAVGDGGRHVVPSSLGVVCQLAGRPSFGPLDLPPVPYIPTSFE